MSFLGYRKYPVPFFKPMGVFFVAGALIFYTVNGMQNAGLKAPENANNPKNPYRSGTAGGAH